MRVSAFPTLLSYSLSRTRILLQPRNSRSISTNAKTKPNLNLNLNLNPKLNMMDTTKDNSSIIGTMVSNLLSKTTSTPPISSAVDKTKCNVFVQNPEVVAKKLEAILSGGSDSLHVISGKNAITVV